MKGIFGRPFTSMHTFTRLVRMILSVTAFIPGPAFAFQILSGFTDPCHEQMTLSTLLCVQGGVFGPPSVSCAGSPLFPSPVANVDPLTLAMGEMLADEVGVSVDSDVGRVAVASLFAGVRFPDVRDNSAYDLMSMRPLLLSDEHEHLHFIRRSYDDGLSGNRDAVAAGRDFIESEIQAALDVAAADGQRYRVHSVVMDFYGSVDVLLYEPLFRLGVALHSFQDSFSHTLRSDDLTVVYSVLNSIEALGGTLEESTDGIAHSMAMDRCFDEALPLARAAAAATAELVDAVAAAAAGDDYDRVRDVLDYWLGLQDGCCIENEYCESPWLELARKDPFKPIIPMVTGCSTGSGRDSFLFLLLVPFMAFRLRRIR